MKIRTEGQKQIPCLFFHLAESFALLNSIFGVRTSSIGDGSTGESERRLPGGGTGEPKSCVCTLIVGVEPLCLTNLEGDRLGLQGGGEEGESNSVEASDGDLML